MLQSFEVGLKQLELQVFQLPLHYPILPCNFDQKFTTIDLFLFRTKHRNFLVLWWGRVISNTSPKEDSFFFFLGGGAENEDLFPFHRRGG